VNCCSIRFARWGYKELVGCVLVAAVAVALLWQVVWWPLALLPAIPALIVVWFFRDPDRVPQGDDRTAVAPADGLVVEVARVDDPWVGPGSLRISIYLNVFNVHVNRIPFDGRVASIRRAKGKFRHANSATAATENASVRTEFETQTTPPLRFAVTQITGMVARRIICDLSEGMAVARGSRFGMIKFGSRTELVLPAEFNPAVEVGSRVKGGETAVAVLAPPTATPQGASA
jgi:phosphatidylserine decarboxylase